MPSPRNLKEVKQFLGLAGYYHNFVLRFADISQPLTSLMKKDTPSEWAKTCHYVLNLLKKYLTENPSLKCHNLEKHIPCYRCKQSCLGMCFNPCLYSQFRWQRKNNLISYHIDQWFV